MPVTHCRSCSDALAQDLQRVTGNSNLAFYDAIAPVVDAETIDHDAVFAASRYDKAGEDASWYTPRPPPGQSHHRRRD